MGVIGSQTWCIYCPRKNNAHARTRLICESSCLQSSNLNFWPVLGIKIMSGGYILHFGKISSHLYFDLSKHTFGLKYGQFLKLS